MKTPQMALAQARKLRKYLRELVIAVEVSVAALDAEMEKPSDVRREKRIAAICNHLELWKDQAKHFGLGLPLGKPVAARKPKLPPCGCTNGAERGQCGNALQPDPCYCECHGAS